MADDLRKHWGWLLALGLVYDLLGVLGLIFLLAFTMAGILFFGVLLLLGGGMQLAQAFRCRDWRGSLLGMLGAALYAIGGLVVVADPLMAASFLTLVIAGILIAGGVVRLLLGLKHREVIGGGALLILSSVVSVVLGGLIIAGWPVTGLFAIGLFISIELLIHGQAYIVLAMMARAGMQKGAAGQ